MFNQPTIMSYTISRRYRKAGNFGKFSTHRTFRTNLIKRGQEKRQKREDTPHIKPPCIFIEKSDISQFTCRMSPESRRISIETRWSVKGFVPSFETTDKILMEAARRTYNTLGIITR